MMATAGGRSGRWVAGARGGGARLAEPPNPLLLSPIAAGEEDEKQEQGEKRIKKKIFCG
ncbi:hypothetical protein [Oryza sativa Japonica Group]|uniref:Uncharacterized protein n=1 Tax=Oryza sativa subsp. japonica TaxID=39947 RepID=Q5QMW5_ORYSJ|nr:hypothetical protein [Oryza sativa Japonica Group]